MLRSLIFRRNVHCIGCGDKLIVPLSNTRQFPSENQGPRIQVRDNEKLDHIYSKMSDAQREALQWGESGEKTSPLMDKHIVKREMAVARANSALSSNLCKPCVVTREGTSSTIRVPKTDNTFLGKRFHVLDALDFPLGVPKSFSNGDLFVVNRCDLVVSHGSQLPKLKTYMMKTYFSKIGVSEDRVILTSALRGWRLKKLAEQFVSTPKHNYFTGPTNAGKTHLAHTMSSVSKKLGATTWPFPFVTQKPLTYKTLPEYRSKAIVDMPSESAGSSIIPMLLPDVLRKVMAGTRMIKRDPKYAAPVIKAKSGQVVSIGGLVVLEFPALPNKLPIHVFANVGGLAHTDYGHTFRDIDKVNEINNSQDPSQMKMRMHDTIGLQLERKFAFSPWVTGTKERQSVVLKNLGFLQPFLFGDFPEDYQINVWAPQGHDVGLRPEILPYIAN